MSKRKVKIRKYSLEDEFVVKFEGTPEEIKALEGIFDVMGFSVKDRCNGTLTVRGTMK